MGRCSTPEELQQFLDDRLDALETEVIAGSSRGLRRLAGTCSSRSHHVRNPPAVPARSGPIEAEGWVDDVLERVKAKGPRPPLVSAEDRQNRDREFAWSLHRRTIAPARSRRKAQSRSSARPLPDAPGVPDHSRDRPWRHGRGVRGRGREPEPSGCREDTSGPLT